MKEQRTMILFRPFTHSSERHLASEDVRTKGLPSGLARR